MSRLHLRHTALLGAGVALLIVLAVSLRGATVDAQGPTPASTPDASPTPDPTVTVLEQEKLVQEVRQLQQQNDQSVPALLRRNTSTLLTAGAAAIVGLFGIYRWFGDRRDAREKSEKEQQRWHQDRVDERAKRAEEQFQKVVEWLGSGNEATQVGAAVTLRTFLQPGYEQFYAQVFNLAVANLRLQPTDTTNPLSQALAIVFRESFIRTRDHSASRTGRGPNHADALDAAEVRLPQAYLANADLKGVWMLMANLTGANLTGVNLTGANLGGANLTETDLGGANLTEARLRGAILIGAKLGGAKLGGAKLTGALFDSKTQWPDGVDPTSLGVINMEQPSPEAVTTRNQPQ